MSIEIKDGPGPQFVHDCDGCRFLGRYVYQGRNFDLYHCAKSDGGTVLARFGDEGPDYGSIMVSIIQRGATAPINRTTRCTRQTGGSDHD